MRKNMHILLILLVAGIYFSFDSGEVKAQAGVFTFTLDNDQATKTTTTTDTESVSWSLRITNTGTNHLGNYDFAVTSSLTEVSVTPAYTLLEGGDSTAVTLTISRLELTTAGTYSATATATEHNTSHSKSITVSVTVTVGTTTQTQILTAPTATDHNYFDFKSSDPLNQTTNINDTNNFTWTLRVSNTSEHIDIYNFEVSSVLIGVVVNPNEITIDADDSGTVTMTVSRRALTNAGKHTVYVVAKSQFYPSDQSVITITITVEVDTSTSTTTPPTSTTTPPTSTTTPPTSTTTPPTSTTTPPTSTTTPTEPDLSTHKVILSEFMFEAGGGNTALPQWIEVYNDSNSTVNLKDWKFQWNSLQLTPVAVTTTLDADFHIPAQQARLIVTALGRYSGSNLSNATVYQLRSEKIGEGLIIEYIQNITGGFSLKLKNPDDEVIDHIGTLSDDGEKKAWELPETLIEGYRSSLIRRFDAGVPRSGTEKRGWIRAINAKRVIPGLYYGGSFDIGTPGYRRGKPLPVELSQFSAKYVNSEVVIAWTTESELDNAGFNIYRSTSRTKKFQRINPKLIQGAGTTGQRTQYQFIDKTAKPVVAYYYRLEDIDLSGTRGVSTTYRLRGVIVPTSKHITTWGTLKDLR